MIIRLEVDLRSRVSMIDKSLNIVCAGRINTIISINVQALREIVRQIYFKIFSRLNVPTLRYL